MSTERDTLTYDLAHALTYHVTESGLGVYCWRNAAGARVSRYFASQAEALRFRPAFPRR